MTPILEHTWSQPLTFVKEADILKSIAHPVRLKILTLLYQQDCHVKIITERLGLTQAVTSSHLRRLRNFGIVDGQRKSVEMHYHIADPFARRIAAIINDTDSDNL